MINFASKAKSLVSRDMLLHYVILACKAVLYFVFWVGSVGRRAHFFLREFSFDSMLICDHQDPMYVIFGNSAMIENGQFLALVGI